MAKQKFPDTITIPALAKLLARVGERHAVVERRIRRAAERLGATRSGRDWIITAELAEKIAAEPRRGPGNPTNPAEAGAAGALARWGEKKPRRKRRR